MIPTLLQCLVALGWVVGMEMVLQNPQSLEFETCTLNVPIMCLLLTALFPWVRHVPFSLNEELLQGKFIHPCRVLEDQTTWGDKITNTLLEG